jgi:predicted NAD/FAD-binding protein
MRIVSSVVVWVSLIVSVVLALIGKAMTWLRNIVVHRRTKKQHLPGVEGAPVRVAVIGGGIAGTSAAWALAELAGRLPGGAPSFDTHLYEERDALGGNAKTHLWTDGNAKSEELRTGLSVLGWPAAYFKNYEVLLKRLDVPRETVYPTFLVSTDGETVSWAHGEANAKWREDMQRWDRGVAAIRKVNDFFAKTLPAFTSPVLQRLGLSVGTDTLFPPRPDDPPSFYEVSMLNPMNLIPAKYLMCTVFRVSKDFWATVVVSVYSSSFLTGILDDVPAVIVPALDDIISVGLAAPVKPLNTWSENSSRVFDALATRIGHRQIHLSADVAKVTTHVDRDTGAGRHLIVGKDGTVTEFDFVIFACPASAVNKLTQGSRLRTRLFETVIGNVRYETERDRNFVHGTIHTDRNAIPSPMQELFFTKRFSNYVRVLDKSTGQCCNVFALGTWIPPALSYAKATGRRGNKQVSQETRFSGGAFDCYVSYDAHENIQSTNHRRHMDVTTPQPKPRGDKIVGAVDNSFAHPVLSPTSMALAASLRLLQGEQGVFYCGSYATPGNGHDLSHLSGLAAAAAVVEAVMGKPRSPLTYYAHMGHADDSCAKDFVNLRRLMGL